MRQWIARTPEWIEVRTAPAVVNPALVRLDLGERDALQLAIQLNAETVLIDEARGRRVAESFHLRVRGTLGILEHAAQIGKINFREALGKLEQTRFRISPNSATSSSAEIHNPSHKFSRTLPRPASS